MIKHPFKGIFVALISLFIITSASGTKIHGFHDKQVVRAKVNKTLKEILEPTEEDRKAFWGSFKNAKTADPIQLEKKDEEDEYNIFDEL